MVRKFKFSAQYSDLAHFFEQHRIFRQKTIMLYMWLKDCRFEFCFSITFSLKMQFVVLIIIIITKINFFLPQKLKENKWKISIKNNSDLTNVSRVVCGPEYQLWCAIVSRANVGHIRLTTYLKNQEENHYNSICHE